MARGVVTVSRRIAAAHDAAARESKWSISRPAVHLRRSQSDLFSWCGDVGCYLGQSELPAPELDCEGGAALGYTAALSARGGRIYTTVECDIDVVRVGALDECSWERVGSGSEQAGR